MHSLSRISSATSASGPSLSLSSPADPSAQTSAIHTLSSAAAETEFRSEVAQSLERAFAEGHSVENAAVELKTLRMASNVPLRRVREAVVGAIVDRIPLVPGDTAAQRAEIAKTVRRWGPLIDKIGGVDPVETVEVLQYHCAGAGPRQPLFAQVLAQLYQQDLVEEDDIRTWHASPAAKGEPVKPGPALLEGLKKCWVVGAKMIEQFDSDSSEEESEDSDDEEAKPTPAQPAAKREESESEEEESEEGFEDDSEDNSEDELATAKPTTTSFAPPRPAASASGASKPAQLTPEDSDSGDELEEFVSGDDEPPVQDAAKPIAPTPAGLVPTVAAASAKEGK